MNITKKQNSNAGQRNWFYISCPLYFLGPLLAFFSTVEFVAFL